MLQVITSRFNACEGETLYLVHTEDGPEWVSAMVLADYIEKMENACKTA